MKLTKLKRFNDEGMKRFSDFIEETRAKEKINDAALLYQNLHEISDLLDNDFSCDEEIDSEIEFETRLEMAEYLIDSCPSLENMLDDYNCWAWLAAFYFVKLRGRRGKKIQTQRKEHFIPDSYNRKTPRLSLDYRHSVRSPYWHAINFKDEKDLLKFLFTGRKFYEMGDPIENVGGNLKILRSKSIRNTFLKLYQNPKTKTVKSGTFSRIDFNDRNSISGKGGARRFINPLLPRIKKSFDVEVMNPEEIINISSPEISKSKWVKN